MHRCRYSSSGIISWNTRLLFNSFCLIKCVKLKRDVQVGIILPLLFLIRSFLETVIWFFIKLCIGSIIAEFLLLSCASFKVQFLFKYTKQYRELYGKIRCRSYRINLKSCNQQYSLNHPPLYQKNVHLHNNFVRFVV